MVRRNSRQPLSIFLRLGKTHADKIHENIFESRLAFLKIENAGLMGRQSGNNAADRFVGFENDFELRLAVPSSMNHLTHSRKTPIAPPLSIDWTYFQIKNRFPAKTP